MHLFENVVAIAALDPDRPYVQSVKTADDRHHVLKFVPPDNAQASLYNQKIMLDLNLPVVSLHKGCPTMRENLDRQNLFGNYANYDVLVMPFVQGETFGDLNARNQPANKKIFKDFADNTLPEAIVTNGYDLNLGNVYADAQTGRCTIIDTQFGLKGSAHVPVGKMFETLTATSKEVFPHFNGYNDRTALLAGTKRVDSKVQGYQSRMPEEYHEAYVTICLRNDELKSFAKCTKTLKDRRGPA